MSEDAYSWLVMTPVLGLVSLIVLHWLLAQITGGERAYGCVLRAFAGGFVFTLALGLACLYAMDVPWFDAAALLLFNAVIFAALGFGYINFVGLSIASLRIRVLQELLLNEGGLTREKMLERYNPHVLIGNRIDRLTSGGQLILHEERFYSGRSGVLWISRVIRFTRFVVLGRRP